MADCSTLCALLCRLAQATLQRAEVSLRPYLQRFLATIIAGDPTDSELRDQRMDVIMQVSHPYILRSCVIGPFWSGR